MKADARARQAALATVRFALARGYLTRAQAREGLLVQEHLRAAGRLVPLLSILCARCLPPAVLPELRDVYRQALGTPADLPPAIETLPASVLASSQEQLRRPEWDDPGDVQEFLRRTEEGPGPSPGATASGKRPPWAPGTRLGRLIVIRQLGAGGMGTVWLAEDDETGVRYAVKTLPADVAPEWLLRFQREGQAQAAVDAHPNVVRVHSAGEALGQHYLVMDVASGGDLSTRLEERGPFPVAEGATLVAALARGLAAVHAGGILHCDLKPANVLFDERGTPQLGPVRKTAPIHGPSATEAVS